MPATTIDGLTTRYEVHGSGPPLLMYSPGGFDAVIEKWRTQGIYADLKLLEQLPQQFTCVVFDRRETGASGGRVERIAWSDYARQGAGLLDHLGFDAAHVMGGCMGCSAAIAFGVAYPLRARSLVLFWPVGGAKYRLSSHQRFAEHLAFVRQHGLAAIAELARTEGITFGTDPRGGPWASVLKHDALFAERYVKQDVDRYRAIVAGMARTLMDRDTAPGAEPEDLLQLDRPTLIVPGSDAAHATSAARYLQECISGTDYWDAPVADQTATATLARLTAFLADAERGCTVGVPP
jgi:pimeloyl-ACP methyl ester carboxylesterase